MSQFDESKIKRDAEGKFANKGPAAEADDVSLESADSFGGRLDQVEFEHRTHQMALAINTGQGRLAQDRVMDVMSQVCRARYPQSRYVALQDDGDSGFSVVSIYDSEGKELDGDAAPYQWGDPGARMDWGTSNIDDVPSEVEVWEDDAREITGQFHEKLVDLDEVDKVRERRLTNPDLHESRTNLEVASYRSDVAGVNHLGRQLRTYTPSAKYVEYEISHDRAKLSQVLREDGSAIEMDFEPNAPGTDVRADVLPTRQSGRTDLAADGHLSRVAIDDLL